MRQRPGGNQTTFHFFTTLAVAAFALTTVACDRDPTEPSGRLRVGGRSADVSSRELVASIDAGPLHACAVTVGGHVYCWGDNLNGRADVPVGLDGVVQVSLSYGHTCALKSNGTVVCWGNGGNGETAVPSGLNDAVEVSAGSTFTCVRRSNGVDFCWGTNFFGEAVIPGLSNLAQLSAGYTHTCAIKSDFTGACWAPMRTAKAPSPPTLAPSRRSTRASTSIRAR